MLFFFRGRGILILLIVAACLLAVNYLADAWFGPGTYESRGLPKLVALWLAAALVQLARPWLGHGEDRWPWPHGEGRLLFIRARYWPRILLALGMVMLLV